MKLHLLIPLALAAAITASGQPRHYSYQGRDPAQWTSLSASTAQAGASGAGYTTYAGDTNEFQLVRILTDAGGDTYVLGSRIFHSLSGDLGDVYIKKLDVSGNTVFTASLGGKGNDQPRDLAVDAAGNLYIAGNTSSPNFPLRNPVQSSVGRGSGFLAKLSGDGSRLMYSTYFGGLEGPTTIRALAVDAGENVYLTGGTFATDFPATGGWPAKIPSFPITSGAFVSKLAASGDKVVFSDLIVGNTVACGGGSSCFLSTRNTNAIAVGLDGAGNVLIAGNTNTTDLPTTPGVLAPQGIGAFVAKISPDGSSRVFLTYLGTANYVLTPFSMPGNIVDALAVDASGSAYLTGYTTDPAFPATPNTFQSHFSGPASPPSYPPPPSDAFAAKLKPDGSAMEWATFLGAAADESGTAIALGSAGELWVAGTTASAAFPQTSGGWPQAGDFVLALAPGGTALSYAARFPAGTAGQGLTLDPGDVLHIAGAGGIVAAFDPRQPPASRVFGLANAAGGILTGRIAPGEVLSFYGEGIGPGAPATFTLDPSGRVPKSLAGVEVFFDDIPAPLLYVSSSQVNAVAPFGVQEGSGTNVRISFNGAAAGTFAADVVNAIPEIFKNADSQAAAALNQDGTVNSASNAAPVGSIVSIWASGAGRLSLEDGEVPAAPQNALSCEVFAGSERAQVLYTGVAPGMVAGIVQVNFQLPTSFIGPLAQVPVTLGCMGVTSAPAMVYVRGQ